MKPEEELTDEELVEVAKKARKKTISVTRWVIAVAVLAVLSLSWYGAEMLIYKYSQPSVVKAIVAVCIAVSVSGKVKKEMIINDNKQEFIEGFVKAIKDKAKERGRAD